MINVGIYLGCKPHGGGTYQYNLAVINGLKNLDSKKYKVTAFFSDDDWTKLVPDNFIRVRIKKTFISKVCLRVINTLDKSLESSRKLSKWFDPVVCGINRSTCDIVIYPSQDTISYQTKKKSLSTIHDLMHRYESHFEEYQGGEFERRERHYSSMCKYSSAILVDSYVGKAHVIESYDIKEKNIFVLPFVPPLYLQDAESTNVIVKYNLPQKYVFYPAQFWEHKNHINLLKAMKLLKEQYNSDIKLVLVGAKKNNYQKVIASIEQLGLSNDVLILGYVDNDDMASLYKNALATTFVSLIGPTNIPPMAALTLGSPLICSNVYAMPEQISGAGLLVNPYEPLDIAKAIYVLSTNQKLAANYVEKGYGVIKKYGQLEFSNKLKVCIDKLLCDDFN